MVDTAIDRSASFNKGTPIRRKWGYYVDHLREDDLVIKTLVIEPNQAISFQKHKNRHEAWTVAEGYALVTSDQETERMIPGESFFVEADQWHTVQNLSSEDDLVIVEVQLKYGAEKISEDDIERM